jgi:protein-disulfide isomerase
MKKLAAFAALTTLALFFSQPALPQSSEEALRKEIEGIKAGLTAIQKELQEIKVQLQSRPAQPPGSGQPQNVVLSVDGAVFKGNQNAKVTLIEFTDYQCPFCARHLNQTAPQIDKEYIQTGKVKYVMRDFPIPSLHPQAFKGHEAAHCAGEQGKYWEMHGRLFANQKAMSPKDLSAHAEALALELPKFQQCLDSGKYAAKVSKDQAEGQKAGVIGTPSFFLGLTEPNGSTVKTVKTVKGAQPYAAFKDALDGLLEEKSK